MKTKVLNYGLSLLTAGAALFGVTASVQAADKKPSGGPDWGLRFAVTFLFPK